MHPSRSEMKATDVPCWGALGVESSVDGTVIAK
jgi:hypothetical protein